MISLANGHRFYIKQEHAHTRYTTPRPSCPWICHISSHTLAKPLRTCHSSRCSAQWWPGFRGWTGPVGQRFGQRGAGGGQESEAEGGLWGVAGPSPQAYGLHKIMSKFMGRSTSPQKGPPRGRRCYVTYGGSEGSS